MVPGMSDESRNEEGTGAESTGAESTGAPKPDKDANLGDLGDAGHAFDQTNGLIDGLEGESDGEAEEGDTDAGDGTIVPPVLPSGR
jgi:hypothetical protein